MNHEVFEALGQIIREKHVDREIVLDTLKSGLIAAAKKRFGTGDNLEVRIDEKNGSMEIIAIRSVVDEVVLPETEINLSEARKINPSVQIGESIEQRLPFDTFGRNAIQSVKQVVVQRVREAERDNVFEMYKDRVGEIVNGSVQQVDRGNIIVKLDRSEALVPWREQIRREKYKQGETIRSYIFEVQKSVKGPQILLSRTHPGFLEMLFRMEVPEIHEGIVEVKSVAREPGDRSKIAVFSHDDRVDAVGACVGMKGTRVQSVVRELNNERIDIVPWSSDPTVFVTHALRPANVSQVSIVDIKEKRMRVIVEDDQLSLAIGKAGQNARLAARLTGWNIDLVKRSELERQLMAETFGPDRKNPFKDVETETIGTPVEELEGLSTRWAEKLRQAGYETVESLEGISRETLLALPGVGEATADKLLATIQAKQ